ncbi:putative profilin [Wickerhamomyces ciferrii]|uniref:Profilin n=1 Tax=Wickerhamomyces ciferrii (strain ATCC 14091 / BCRC 22168 / CBS 111 / JCM 3599 / NBRC 0793 / NRRL Y-1031 F-60-10) TaxID=1206466 RepID=K0L0A2_WICCF|nr:putative profilin [Wickerhamomyces ciferrii]CCH46843.1 putative profilin [Wickerhamomyces ciferrii]
MSWEYNLVASGKIDKAAIYSRDGDNILAQSDNFSLADQEIKSLVAGFEDPSSFLSSGLRLEDQTYRVTKADDRGVYGKNGAEGALAVRTNQSILIAHYPAGVQAPEANTVVEKLADFLIMNNY